MKSGPAQGEANRVFEEALRRHIAGQMVEAIAGYQRALRLQPEYPEAHNNLGVALQSAGNFSEAAAHYERAIALKDDYADAHNNLGVALGALGRLKDAVGHYQRAVALRPNYIEAHHNLAVALAALGQTRGAVEHYERAIALKPRDAGDAAGIHNNLGVALAALGRTAEAVAQYERALSLNPAFADAHTNLGIALVELGRIEEARKHYDRAIELDPANVPAHFNRAEILKFRAGDPALDALESAAGRINLTPRHRMLAHFALGKAFEDAGDYGRAFEAWNAANRLKRGQIRYDSTAIAELFRRMIATFDRDIPARTGDPSTVPIFVVGMPRSGSSLIEQILASHPRVQAAGELEDFEMALNAALRGARPTTGYPECLRTLDDATLSRIAQGYLSTIPEFTEGRIRLVDKMPANFLYIGLIRLVFPNARIIHTTRDAVDTCVSCYSKHFSSGQLFSYDLAELGRYYRGYAEVMAHWRSVLPESAMFEIAYEAVVNDLEGEARKLIAYCGLGWDESCLTFQKAARPVRTASAAQVRQPMFRTSMERWRRYEPWLGPLFAELGNRIS